MLQVPIQNPSSTKKLLVTVTTEQGSSSDVIEALQSRIIDLPTGAKIAIEESVEPGNGPSSESVDSASSGEGAKELEPSKPDDPKKPQLNPKR